MSEETDQSSELFAYLAAYVWRELVLYGEVKIQIREGEAKTVTIQETFRLD